MIEDPCGEIDESNRLTDSAARTAPLLLLHRSIRPWGEFPKRAAFWVGAAPCPTLRLMPPSE